MNLTPFCQAVLMGNMDFIASVMLWRSELDCTTENLRWLLVLLTAHTHGSAVGLAHMPNTTDESYEQSCDP